MNKKIKFENREDTKTTMSNENQNPADTRSKINESQDNGHEILTTVTTHGPGQQQVSIPNIIPLLPIRNTVAFPGTVMPLNIGRETSKKG